jgi:protein SMG6
MLAQGLNKTGERERWAMLTSGCTLPLPEDWCMRGMEWVGRRVFERGYWKNDDEKSKEVKLLDASEGGEVTDGIIEDGDEDEGAASKSMLGGETAKRWTRIVRCAVGIAQVVDGFKWVEGTRRWRVEGALERKVQQWKEEDRIDREAEEKRRRGTRWADDAMEVDGDVPEDNSHESEDDEGDTAEVKALKV